MNALSSIRSANIADSTKSTYSSAITRLSEVTGFTLSSRKSFLDAVTDVDAFYEPMKKQDWSHSTRCSILTALLATLRFMGAAEQSTALKRAVQKFKHIHFVLSKNSQRRNGQLSDREELNWVTFTDVLAAEKRMSSNEYGSKAHLLLALYCLWAPLRADFDRVKIYATEDDVPAHLKQWMHVSAPRGYIKKEVLRPVLPGIIGGGESVSGGVVKLSNSRDPDMPEENFLLLAPSTLRPWKDYAGGTAESKAEVEAWERSPRLILLSYKTANTYGRTMRVMPPVLTKILKASLEIEPREWLFLGRGGVPFVRSKTFSEWAGAQFRRIFPGKKVGVTLLRHIYLSQVDYNASTARQLSTLARDMCHSEVTQRRYVRLETDTNRGIRSGFDLAPLMIRGIAPMRRSPRNIK